MKKFIIRLLAYVFCVIFFLGLFLSFIFFGISPQFDTFYHSVINKKYDYYMNTSGKKVTYISGSSGTFCIDDKLVSDSLNIPFINLGLHASFGIGFELEMSKANINEGDIIIMGFEESTYNSSAEQSDIYVLATGMNDNFKLFKFFSNKQKKDFVKYLPTYFFQKLDRSIDKTQMESSGVYSSNSFDENGIFTYDCEEIPSTSQNIVQIANMVDVYLNDKLLQTFREYREYVESKGASAYIIFPPISKNSVITTSENHDNFKKTIEEKTGIKVINDIQDIMFEDNYLYDFNFHCNNKGQEKYTNMLIESIENILKGR